MDYESAEEAARRWGISPRWVQALCHSRRIPGAQRLDRVWLIPRTAKKPVDQRVTLHRGSAHPLEKQ